MEIPEQEPEESERDYALFCDWLTHRSMSRTARNSHRIWPKGKKQPLSTVRIRQIAAANRWKERAPDDGGDPLAGVIADNRAEAADLCIHVLAKTAEVLDDDPDVANKLLGAWSKAMTTVHRLHDSPRDKHVTDAAMAVPLRDLADAMVKNMDISDLDALVSGEDDEGDGGQEQE